MFSYTGADGQRAILTFIQGEKCALLPTDCNSKHDLETVTFKSFQLTSNHASAIGRMRYKIADGTYGNVNPQAVGQRVLFAQLLNLNRIPELAESSQRVAKRRKLEASYTESHVSCQEGGAEASSEEACPAAAVGGSKAGASQDAGSGNDDSAVEEDTAAAEKRAVTDKNRERRKKRDQAAIEAVSGSTARRSGRRMLAQWSWGTGSLAGSG